MEAQLLLLLVANRLVPFNSFQAAELPTDEAFSCLQVQEGRKTAATRSSISLRGWLLFSS
eukprot:7197612-Karenia_brevis.AAC.1